MIEKLQKAFTFIFSEKDLTIKIGLVVALTIMLSGQILDSDMSISEYFSTTYDFDSYGTAANASSVAEFGIYSFLGLMIALVVGFVGYMGSNWYSYEVAQAAIEQRPTKSILEYSLTDTIKKSFKFFLVDLVYWVALFMFICCFSCILGFIVSFGIASVAETGSGALLGGVLILYCGFVLFFGAIFVVQHYFIVLPAKLRIAETNTFSEGFSKETFKLGFKNWKTFLIIFAIELVMYIVAMVLFMILYVFGILFMETSPAIGAIVVLIVGIVGNLIGYYYLLIVRPYFIGEVYRERIMNK